MEPGVLITLMICGTILLVTIIGIGFAMWVISKGIDIAAKNKQA
jgi:hypothetical protein